MGFYDARGYCRFGTFVLIRHQCVLVLYVWVLKCQNDTFLLLCWTFIVFVITPTLTHSVSVGPTYLWWPLFVCFFARIFCSGQSYKCICTSALTQLVCRDTTICHSNLNKVDLIREVGGVYSEQTCPDKWGMKPWTVTTE